VEEIFREYGLTGEPLGTVVAAITEDPSRWIDFMMRFELGLERPDPKRAPGGAATIALSYLVGGLIPLGPYIFIRSIRRALWLSVLLTGLPLLVFGAIKGQFTGLNKVRSALQTLLVGRFAAGAAYLLAGLFG
jgi:vacuolar iron transporter family protein